MRKIYFALLILLIPALLWAAFGVDTVSGPAAVDTVSGPAYVDGVQGLDWSEILLFWRAESLTMSNPGDCYNTENVWTDSGASLTEAAKYSGTYGVDADAASENYDLNNDTGHADGTSGRVGFWLARNANCVGADCMVLRLYDDSNNWISILHPGGDEFEINWRSGGSYEAYCGTSGADTGSTYKFVEVFWEADVGAGSDYIQVNVNGTKVSLAAGCESETLTPLTGLEDVQFGVVNSPTTADFYLDVLISSSDPSLDLYGSGGGHAFATSCP